MKTTLSARVPLAASIAFVPFVAVSMSLADIGHGKNAPAGQPGDTPSRSVNITMYDSYYEPESIVVNAGETVRFVVSNQGRLVHEFNIGTADMHLAHQDEMQMMVDHGVLSGTAIDHQAAQAMQASMGHGLHEDPNSVLLEPGKTGEVIWTFPRSGTLELACNVPGHYDAGMIGEILIAQ